MGYTLGLSPHFENMALNLPGPPPSFSLSLWPGAEAQHPGWVGRRDE